MAKDITTRALCAVKRAPVQFVFEDSSSRCVALEQLDSDTLCIPKCHTYASVGQQFARAVNCTDNRIDLFVPIDC